MVELESGGRMSRAEVAAFLREFVAELEGESPTVATGVERDDRRSGEVDRERDAGTADRGRDAGAADRGRDAGAADPGADAQAAVRDEDARQLTFVVGGDSATVTIPEVVDFDVEVESRSPLLQSGVNQAVEFHFSWEIDEERGDDSIDLK